ncbi:hypothetical protein [Nostoc sp. ChiQUE01b]|nr:hypothetical protein [Nostoc sp. ChiQUE01b]MDZ8262450.1 hypothetical protein [Nostoc sp. ChiQUE01b]
MAKIQINDLTPAPESYFTQLTDAEMNSTKGGIIIEILALLILAEIIF